MKKGLYPVIAGALITLWLLAEIFGTQINTASPLLQGALIGIIALIALGAVLLAMWDTEMIGGKKNKGK